MDIIEKKLRKDVYWDKQVLKDWQKKLNNSEKVLNLFLKNENGTPIRCGDNLFGEERLCLRCKVVKDLRYSPKP